VGSSLFIASWPWYYDTYWRDGAPYYYANDVYFQWNSGAGEYETIKPVAGLSAQVNAQTSSDELFVYPKSGQSSEQQARDREDCHRWAVAQVGFNPRIETAPERGTTAMSNASADWTAAKYGDYLRAEEACLEGRNYSVE
jgi:hypothetical protein